MIENGWNEVNRVNMRNKNKISCLFYEAVTPLLLTSLLFLAGCSNGLPPENSMIATPERLARQPMQTRIFETTDNANLIRSIMNVIQDQHYTLRETNGKVGTLYADQTYDIGKPISFFGIPLTHIHQKPGDAGFNFQFGPFSMGGRNGVYLAKKISSISVVCLPIQQGKAYEVHVSIEIRTFFNTGQVGQVWLVTDPKIYQNFFDALSKASYLQGKTL